MKSTLTIIKQTNSLVNYPITWIPQDVLDLMTRSHRRAPSKKETDKTSHLIMFLEAFFHVSSFSVSYLTLSTPLFETMIRAFMGALNDEGVFPGSSKTRREYIRATTRLLNEMRVEVPLIPSLSIADANSLETRAAWEAMKPHMDAKALRYWNGWEIQGRKGKVSYLPIAQLWNSHGEEFAEVIYEKYRQNASKQLAPAHSDFNLWLQYFSENADRWPASCLQHPIKIKQLFTHSMLYNFNQAVDTGCSIANRTKSYSKFIYTMDEVFITPGLWARPFSNSLPRPVVKSPPGSHTNLKKTKEGTVIKSKLITDIPLHLTDSQAIDLLFKKIHADNKLVLNWAKARLDNARIAFNLCKELAQSGKVITDTKCSENNIANIGIENICATFQQMGIGYMYANSKSVLGAVSRTKVVEILGIPTVDTFFAFQLLITHAHPCITESYFTHFELYDKRGNLSGFLETNTGHQLVGYKDRIRGESSEQKIDLTPEQADWVELIISLTSIFRRELKEKGDDTWRFLFLHTGGRITEPARPEPLKLNRKTILYQKTMIKEFMAVGGMTEEFAKDFIIRLSVTAYRASAGVEVYLRTHSVEEMARALGHTQYDTSLLSRYLPEPILAFFQTRWIRLFQRGIICQAMKDSPRLLEVARFSDMEELHEFLKNHALRDLPEHLKNPDYLQAPKRNRSVAANDDHADRVVVSIDHGVLTALLSLQAAVAAAKPDSNLCSKAVYWARFSDLVVRDIEEGFNSDLQAYLENAQGSANASHMENLIYATAP